MCFKEDTKICLALFLSRSKANNTSKAFDILSRSYVCIFCKMGSIWSNRGLLAGSGFQAMFINFVRWLDIPGIIDGRRPSNAI